MNLRYGLASRRMRSMRMATVSRYVQLIEFDSYEGEPDDKQRTEGLYAAQYPRSDRPFAKGSMRRCVRQNDGVVSRLSPKPSSADGREGACKTGIEVVPFSLVEFVSL
jgi:hypothetical protein